ncbi:phosphatidate cytidylyltransferase [Aquibium sp. A9E412]|uniref:phosphatidate cytidylyltransferase n=1 Tax=Aquibium sp. A9E412 TaxID=2976767 RepID=UPI0025B22CC1|nr:phosphatidate cytidylyltransferase [Aquibium sp. A9E412]MDN2564706.1 phosphatidate cytidylyltransferase [Aquibium sp. A9E412]
MSQGESGDAGPGPGAPKRRTPGNLQLRVASALVLAAVVLALTYLGGAAFRVLVAAVIVAVFAEWTVMARPRADRTTRWLAAPLFALVVVVLLFGAGPALAFGVLAAAVVVSLVYALVRRRDYWMVTALAYAGVPGLALVYLRGADAPGLVAVLLLFAVVWATDTLAYFSGRGLGGPKLAPRVSPSKTWSGAVGGALGGMAAGLAVALIAGSGVGLPAIAVLALGLSVVAQFGDLFESAVKRRHGVKDSSHLIPGHGGMMDRVDGLLASAVALYVVGALLSGPQTPAHGFFAP